MKIKAIRDVIDTANWRRIDLTGGTAEEFKKQSVGPQMKEQIAKLRALEIPARFAREIARREVAIERCEKTAQRWYALFAAPVSNVIPIRRK